ncbi:MAG: GGDEF domain-containing protein [Spirochaetaceae bacterium]|nr:GGDEF domain-containing protein [Spirochaetaceae bacterium]MBO4704579.1 GGDEF domain-containing protein [Spirochaetaceae bacterium]
MISFYGVIVMSCALSMITLAVIVGKNTVLDKNSIKWFRFTFILVAMGMTFEYVGVLFSELGNVPAWLFVVVTLCEYSLSPCLTLALAKSCGIKASIKPMFAVMAFHAVLEVAMAPFKLIFFITEEGYFSRGDFYWIYLLFCGISFIFIIFVFFHLARKAKEKSLVTLLLIAATFLAGQIPSIVSDHIYTGYFSICITAVLLYIFTQDLMRSQLIEIIGQEQEKSTHDSLTGVANRELYERKAKQINENIKADPQAMHFAICECDLNNLKIINDTYGHESGDFYIKACCKTICNIFKHSPVFRTGGDEFVIILQNEDYERCDEIKKEINDFVLSEVKKEGSVLEKISFAAGFSKFNSKTDRTVGDVLNRADFEMYIHKKTVKASAAI